MIATKIKVYFGDPQTPWPRGSNENTNGVLGQYVPKHTDHTQFTQLQLDANRRQAQHEAKSDLCVQDTGRSFLVTLEGAIRRPAAGSERYRVKRAARSLLVSALFLGLLIPAGASAGRQGSARLSSLESDVLISLNAIRTAHRLVPLRLSLGLSRAARQHSQEMARLGYFAHESADGGSFDSRIARSYPFGATFHHWTVGENLVWQAPNLDATEALRLWMGSPEHRKNILDPTWAEIGISAVHASAAPGLYGGGDTTIITTDFGARS